MEASFDSPRRVAGLTILELLPSDGNLSGNRFRRGAFRQRGVNV